MAVYFAQPGPEKVFITTLVHPLRLVAIAPSLLQCGDRKRAMLFSPPNSLHSPILSPFPLLGIMIKAAISRLKPWLASMVDMVRCYPPMVAAEKHS